MFSRFLLPSFPPCPTCGGKSAPVGGEKSTGGKAASLLAFALMAAGFFLTMTSKSFAMTGVGVAVFTGGIVVIRVLLSRAARAGKFLCMACKQPFSTPANP